MLLIGDYPPPMGGIAVHVQQLHQAFRRAGMQCHVLNIGKGGQPDPGVIDGRGYANFSRHLVQNAAQGRLLHFHTGGNSPKAWTVAMAVAAAGQLFRAPTALTVHSGEIPDLFSQDAALRRRAQLALRGYAHVIAVSEAVRESLMALGLPGDRVSMHPAFCASEVHPGDPREALAAIRARRHPLLSFAHNTSPVYGRELMFQALARLATRHPRIGLAVFGPGTASAELRADAERFGVTSFLEDLGELSNEQALAVIHASDAFVRPTRADGDSVSVREALTLGVPVVATDVAQRPPGTIVCREGSAEDLAGKVEQALADRPAPTPQPDCAAFLVDLYRRTGLLAAPRPASAPASFHSSVPASSLRK
ncbi:MAG TPA: glycosyltransferase family 4 protein [Myxococcaceae bacterium]|nr:glycosyltransferase family 4 protein [Myxococcaceae bacterium]